MKQIKLLSFVIFSLLIILVLNSCHPGYHRLTNWNWGKDTNWVKFPDLPAPVRTIISKYADARASADTSDDLANLISLDSLHKAKSMFYADAYSDKFTIPFGWYFKIGKSKYFIHYAHAYSPIIYNNGYLYFDARRYFDTTYWSFSFLKNERIPYEKRFFVKYKLKGYKRVR